MSRDTDHSRRSVLKSVAGSAVGTAVLTGTASASSPDPIDSTGLPDEADLIDPDRVVEDLSSVAGAGCDDCRTECKCSGSGCKGYDYEKAYCRECCRCGGGYICEDWEYIGRCCY